MHVSDSAQFSCNLFGKRDLVLMKTLEIEEDTVFEVVLMVAEGCGIVVIEESEAVHVAIVAVVLGAGALEDTEEIAMAW